MLLAYLDGAEDTWELHLHLSFDFQVWKMWGTTPSP